MTSSVGSEEGSAEEAEESEHTETDGSQLPASPTLGFDGGELFGFEALLPFLFHLGLKDFDGIWRGWTDEFFIGMKGTTRGTDRDQHEGEDSKEGFHIGISLFEVGLRSPNTGEAGLPQGTEPASSFPLPGGLGWGLVETNEPVEEPMQGLTPGDDGVGVESLVCLGEGIEQRPGIAGRELVM